MIRDSIESNSNLTQFDSIRFVRNTMHKVKNKLEVNCANITPESDDLSAPNCILQDSQDLRSTLTASEDDTFKKKVSYEELEKMLYSTFKYNAEINEYCERLQTRYCELLRE